MPTYIREAELTYRRRKTPQDASDPAFTTVRCSSDVAAIARSLIGARLTESLLVFALNGKNKLIGFHEVARGSTTACPVLPADVFRYPLVAGAVGIILAHNHPSGDVTPSQEDRVITRRIVEVAALLGLRMLDHVIVSDERFFSFLDAGELAGPDVARRPPTLATAPRWLQPGSHSPRAAPAGRVRRFPAPGEQSCGFQRLLTHHARGRRRTPFFPFGV